jgi:AcrR family transcriptional regulator
VPADSGAPGDTGPADAGTAPRAPGAPAPRASGAPAAQASGSTSARPGRRRGPRPRHTREQVVEAAIAIADADGLEAVTIRAVAARLRAGAMSLYSYVPDKQALVYAMVEQVSEELAIPPEPSGDWRADVRWFARQQRALVHRHPWLIAALSHRQPLGPATLAYLEYMLAVLEPTGLDAGAILEATALLNGFIINLARAELTDQVAGTDPAEAAAAVASLQELLATGRYPRFAAAVASTGLPRADLAAEFDRLLDRAIDGLIPAPPGRPG